MELDDALLILRAALGEARSKVEAARQQWETAKAGVDTRQRAVDALEAVILEMKGTTPADALANEPRRNDGWVDWDPPLPSLNGGTANGSKGPHHRVGPVKRRHSRDDILTIMRDYPVNKVWPIAEIVEQYVFRGWATHLAEPYAAISHAAGRMATEGTLVRQSPGWYTLPKESPSEVQLAQP